MAIWLSHEYLYLFVSAALVRVWLCMRSYSCHCCYYSPVTLTEMTSVYENWCAWFAAVSATIKPMVTLKLSPCPSNTLQSIRGIRYYLMQNNRELTDRADPVGRHHVVHVALSPLPPAFECWRNETVFCNSTIFLSGQNHNGTCSYDGRTTMWPSAPRFSTSKSGDFCVYRHSFNLTQPCPEAQLQQKLLADSTKVGLRACGKAVHSLFTTIKDW